MDAAAKFMKFSGVGAVATALQYLILIGLVQLAAISATLASAIGFVVSAVVNYLLNYHFTFSSRECHREASVKFVAVAVMGLIGNTSIVRLGTEVWDVHYLLAQMVATIVVVLLTFTGNYVWTFRPRTTGGT